VSSGLFLVVREEAAPVDPDCRAVVLAEGSSNAYLRIMPRFKAQTEGSSVYHTNAVIFEAVSQQRVFLHTSNAVYDTVPDPQSTTLPKNLRTGRIFEANVSSRFSTFFVHKYARFDKSTSLGLPTGAPFRLFHSQSDAFMQASCDPAKGVGRPQRSDGSSAHAPSFRVLSAGKTSSGLGESIADPTNPENHSAKGLWCLELPRRSESVAVTWGASFRVRHVASGRYLMVDAATGSGTSPSTGVQWFEARLVDEVNDSSSSNHPVSPNALLFRVQSAERAAASLIPAGECSVRIEHHYVDPKTGLDKVLYLHNTDLSRAPIEQLVAESSTVNESSSGGMAETSQITSGKMAPKRSLKLIFSTVRSAQDIFKVVSRNVFSSDCLVALSIQIEVVI